MPEAADPYRAAILTVLDDDLLQEMQGVEAQYERELRDALAAKGRATDHLRDVRLDRPFEHLEAELETEHAELLRYHQAKLAKRIRWILESWRDSREA